MRERKKVRTKNQEKPSRRRGYSSVGRVLALHAQRSPRFSFQCVLMRVCVWGRVVKLLAALPLPIPYPMPDSTIKLNGLKTRTCNCRAWEVEARWLPGHLRLHAEFKASLSYRKLFNNLRKERSPPRKVMFMVN